MTDRELLELAAKAAGIDGVWHEKWRCLVYMGAPPFVGGVIHHTWSPLTDDGDALRLAVQLQISVEFGEDGNNGPTYMAGYFTDNGNRLRYAIEHETPAQDASAATRRAIVRAAAEIGKLQS